MSACFDFFAVSKCAYSLRWIRSFATDLYFPNQWQTFLGFLCMRYIDVSETVSVVCICKQTCKNDWRNHKVKIWKGYIFTPVWYNLDIYDFKHYDSLTPYKLSVFEYMYIVQKMQKLCSFVELRALCNGYNSTPGLQIFVQ